MNSVNIKKTPFDIFVDGAKKGWNIAISNILPNILMAFVIIQFLLLTGLLNIIGNLFSPIMALFGLPGESVTILLAGWLSMSGGIGVAVKLYTDGVMDIKQLAIILPAIYLMGSQVQYIGRVLGTAGIKSKYYGAFILFSILNSFLSIVVMRIIVAFA